MRRNFWNNMRYKWLEYTIFTVKCISEVIKVWNKYKISISKNFDI